eukprot:scaffold128_cov328-Pavlova_lutheri.AAC.41
MHLSRPPSPPPWEKGEDSPQVSVEGGGVCGWGGGGARVSIDTDVAFEFAPGQTSIHEALRRKRRAFETFWRKWKANMDMDHEVDASPKRLSFEDVTFHSPEAMAEGPALLAAVRAPSIENYRQALEELGNQTSQRFGAAKKLAKTLSEEGKSAADLAALKARLSSLKHSFLQIETKYRFMEGLSTGHIDQLTEQEEIELQEALATARTDAKQVKQQAQQMREQVDAATTVAVSKLEEVEHDRSVLLAQLEEIHSRIQSKLDASKKEPAPQDLEDGGLTEDECRRMLAAEAKRERQLETTLAAQASETAELESSIRINEDDIEALKRRLEQEELKGGQKKEFEEESVKVARKVEWCREMTELVSKVGGAKLLHTSKDAFQVKLTSRLDSGSSLKLEHEATILLKPNSTAIRGVHLSPADTPIHDLVSSAVENGTGPGPLLREIRGRIVAWHQRAAALKLNSVPMDPVSDTTMIISAGNHKAKVLIPFEWPKVPAELLELIGEASNKSERVAEQLRDNVTFDYADLKAFTATIETYATNEC